MPAAEHLARVHDAAADRPARLNARKRRDASRRPARSRLAAEVQAGRVRRAAVRLGDLDDRERQREREVEVERALVVRDEAEQHDLVALADHALEDERLLDLVVDLAEHGGHLGERHDDLGRDDRRADALEAHRARSAAPTRARRPRRRARCRRAPRRSRRAARRSRRGATPGTRSPRGTPRAARARSARAPPRTGGRDGAAAASSAAWTRGSGT